MGNIRFVNYLNTKIRLDGDYTPQDVLTYLSVNPSEVDMIVHGETLIITPKASGTKGTEPLTTDVESSVISRVAFIEGELVISFKSGVVYKYPEAKVSDYEGLINASSKGRYFRDNIQRMKAVKLG